MSAAGAIETALHGCGVEESSRVEVPAVIAGLHEAGYSIVPSDRPLWERMREAASLLEEVSYRFTGCSTAEARQMSEEKWNAVKLRVWADRWEVEEGFRADLVADLTAEIGERLCCKCSAGVAAEALLGRFDITPKAAK